MMKNIRLLLLGLLLGLQLIPAFAQSVTIDNTEYRQKVLKYLSSDYFITEGVGLKKVYIGQGEAQLVQQLGKPAQVKKPGLLTKDRNFYYKLDNETTLEVGLKNRVVMAIAFSGSVSSQYTTVKGARFGMSPHEITNLYGQGNIKEQSVIYAKLGVRFDFKNSGLKIIRIFRPVK